METNQSNMHTKSQLRRLVGEQMGSWLWGRRSGKPKAERVTAILEFRRLRAMFNAGQFVDEVNARGNTVHRDIDADRMVGFKGNSRYVYDTMLCSDKGWQQYDTDQDAPYFGCWVHLEKRMTMCYCEGDRTLVVCPTVETFKAELADMERFYGPTPATLTHLLNGQVTKYVVARPAVAA